ncbi:MAG: energy transducer TonB [Methylobacter sp.]|nr:energy transducer TonB [Methylobacter sp.]
MKSSVAALLTGVIVSLGLFWLMQFMLMSSRHVVKKTEHLNMMEFVRLKREPQPLPKVEKPPEKKVEQVQDKPQPLQRQKAPPKKQPVIQKAPVVKQEIPAMDVPRLDIPVQAVKTSGPAVNVPAASTPSSIGETGNAQADVGKGAASAGVSTGVIPLERVPPKYPRRAASRHIEGWVKVEFTISTDGDVEDAVVVAAQPVDVFDDAALQAISRWKFKGKIVDGVAVTQRAVQTLQFKLTK